MYELTTQAGAQRVNNKHQNVKQLLMSRYMTVFHILINNELKGLNCLLLLVRAVPSLLPLNQNSQKHRTKIICPCSERK